MKGVNFYGARSEFIVSGSDCGHIFLWDKETESIVQLLEGDVAGVVSTKLQRYHFVFFVHDRNKEGINITDKKSVNFEGRRER